MPVAWSEELVIEKCRAFVDERSELEIYKPFTYEDISERSFQDEFFPSDSTLDRHAGGMQTVQQKLGWVTLELVENWSPDDWVDNGRWARDLLLEVDEVRFDRYLIDEFVGLGLMPARNWIRRLYPGGLYAYRNAVLERTPTFSERVSRGEVSGEGLIENGHWFGLVLDPDHEHAVMPSETNFRQGSPLGLCMSVSQINKHFGSVPEYQAALGWVNEHVVSGWTKEQWIENGRWLYEAANADPDKEPVTFYEALEEAGRRNLGPTGNLLYKYLGLTTNEFKELIGLEVPDSQRKLANEEILANAWVELRPTHQRPITYRDLSHGQGKSYRRLLERFDSVGGVNEQLGIISHTMTWDRNKHVWWGAGFRLRNGRVPKSRDLDQATRQNEGPSRSPIYAYFDNLTDYGQAIEEKMVDVDGYIARIMDDGGVNKTLASALLARNFDLFQDFDDRSGELFRYLGALKSGGGSPDALNVFVRQGMPLEHEANAEFTYLFKVLDRADMLRPGTLKYFAKYIPGLFPRQRGMDWAKTIEMFKSSGSVSFDASSQETARDHEPVR